MSEVSPSAFSIKVRFAEDDSVDSKEEIDLPSAHDTQGNPLTGKRLNDYRELKSFAIILLSKVKSTSKDAELSELLSYLKGLKTIVSLIRQVDDISSSQKKGIQILTDHFQTYCQQEFPGSLMEFSRIREAFGVKFISTDADSGMVTSPMSKCDSEIELFLKVYTLCLSSANMVHIFTLSFAQELKSFCAVLNKPIAEINTRQGILFSTLKHVKARMSNCFSMTNCNPWYERQTIHEKPPMTIIKTYGNKALYLIESPDYDTFKTLLSDLRDKRTKCCILHIGFQFQELLLSYRCVHSVRLHFTDYYQFSDKYGITLLCINLNQEEIEHCQEKIPAQYIDLS